MSAATSIQWTDKTWNPVTGCTKVSPGCAHCYAEGVALRFWAKQYPPVEVAVGSDEATCHSTWTRERRFTDVQVHDDRLLEPLSWRKPAKVFVNSMSDLFHEDVPDAFIDRVFAVMGLAERHTFQVLTKRPERMRDYVLTLTGSVERMDDLEDAAVELGDSPCASSAFEDRGWPLPNVWLGVSVENQHFADERIPVLLQTPAAVRFISAEPLLGPLNFRKCGGVGWCRCQGDDPYVHKHYPEPPHSCARCGHLNCPAYTGLDWVIVGGESGPGARPFDLAWARGIVSQCQSAGVACFMKQAGSSPQTLSLDGTALVPLRFRDRKGGDPSEWPVDLNVRQFPASLAGSRVL